MASSRPCFLGGQLTQSVPASKTSFQSIRERCLSCAGQGDNRVKLQRVDWISVLAPTDFRLIGFKFTFRAVHVIAGVVVFFCAWAAELHYSCVFMLSTKRSCHSLLHEKLRITHHLGMVEGAADQPQV